MCREDSCNCGIRGRVKSARRMVLCLALPSFDEPNGASFGWARRIISSSDWSESMSETWFNGADAGGGAKACCGTTAPLWGANGLGGANGDSNSDASCSSSSSGDANVNGVPGCAGNAGGAVGESDSGAGTVREACAD